jgi:hypothetical protein
MEEWWWSSRTFLAFLYSKTLHKLKSILVKIKGINRRKKDSCTNEIDKLLIGKIKSVNLNEIYKIHSLKKNQ